MYKLNLRKDIVLVILKVINCKKYPKKFDFENKQEMPNLLAQEIIEYKNFNHLVINIIQVNINFQTNTATFI